MGLFRWDCDGCGFPLIGDFLTKRRNKWMCDAVAMDAYGEMAKGIYNGYGTIKTEEGDVEIVNFDAIEVWHRKCWEASGEPAWSGESYRSECQGFFCATHNYSYPPPKTFDHYPRAKKPKKIPAKGSTKRRLDRHEKLMKRDTTVDIEKAHKEYLRREALNSDKKASAKVTAGKKSAGKKKRGGAFTEGKFPIRLLRSVHKHYFVPGYEEFKPRTVWSLTNAFTSAFKETPPDRHFELTARLGKFLEPVSTPANF
jgi:hypothetical protein